MKRSRLVPSVVLLATVLILGGRASAQPESGRGVGPPRHTSPADPDLERRISGTVRERGVLESAGVTEVRSEVQGEATVLTVVPEGTAVKRGDLLIELDDSALREKLLEQELAMTQSQAGVGRAEATLAAADEATEGDVAVAEQALEVAQLAREHFLAEEGELATRTAKAERDVALAERRLRVTAARLERLAGLEDRKAVPQDQRADAELAAAEAEAALEDARGARRLLVEHAGKHQRAALELDVLRARAGLNRERQSARAARDGAAAELEARKAELRLEQAKLERLQRQVEACRVVAPQDGVVVYPPAARRAEPAAVEPGTSVREGQVLARVVNVKETRLRVRVHESRVARVRAGQPVVVRFDALPNRVLEGRVTEVARTAEPGSWPNTDVISYGVLVSIEEIPAELKLGMTALAEIDVSAPVREQEQGRRI